jgi:quercetin dioxygenase-like cupin family protein
MRSLFAGFLLLALASSFVYASDPSPLQDFCVATSDIHSAVLVNGKLCKNSSLVKVDDFSFSGFKYPGNTSNILGAAITAGFVDQFPGVNTLGIAMSRVDFEPNGGLNPPHIHPRSSEILTVVEGTLYAGFITSEPDNKLYSKILTKGESLVFPVGLIHFQRNIGKTHAVAIAGFNSQNPGVVTVANTIFDSAPSIDPAVLATAFQLTRKEAKLFQLKTWADIINFGSN